MQPRRDSYQEVPGFMLRALCSGLSPPDQITGQVYHHRPLLTQE